jgi:hypothetical protein
MAVEKKDQPKWVDLGRVDLRHVDIADSLEEIAAVPAGVDFDEAMSILVAELGFADDAVVVMLPSPMGEVAAHRDQLPHIVEKRADARERYVRLAIATLRDPYEVWEIQYDDETSRHAYIGLFSGKRQMLVVVQHLHGRILWNFMHCDHKSLNKHRHGKLMYERPKKTKGEPDEDSPETIPVEGTP